MVTMTSVFFSFFGSCIVLSPFTAKFGSWQLWFYCLPHFTETIVAINRPVRAWFKGNLSVLSASGTFYIKHPPRGRSEIYASWSDWNNTITFRYCRFSFYSTGDAAFWRIKTPHGCKLFLLFCAKGKNGSTIVASNLFVSITHLNDVPFY